MTSQPRWRRRRGTSRALRDPRRAERVNVVHEQGAQSRCAASRRASTPFLSRFESQTNGPPRVQALTRQIVRGSRRPRRFAGPRPSTPRVCFRAFFPSARRASAARFPARQTADRARWARAASRSSARREPHGAIERVAGRLAEEPLDGRMGQVARGENVGDDGAERPRHLLRFREVDVDEIPMTSGELREGMEPFDDPGSLRPAAAHPAA